LIGKFIEVAIGMDRRWWFGWGVLEFGREGEYRNMTLGF